MAFSVSPPVLFINKDSCILNQNYKSKKMIKQVFQNFTQKVKEICQEMDIKQLIGTFLMAIAIIHPITG